MGDDRRENTHDEDDNDVNHDYHHDSVNNPTAIWFFLSCVFVLLPGLATRDPVFLSFFLSFSLSVRACILPAVLLYNGCLAK